MKTLDQGRLGVSRLDPERIEMLRELGEQTGENILAEIIELFLERTGSRLEEMRRALLEGRFDLINRVAHSLKGSSGNIGAATLQDLAGQLEAEASTDKDRCARLFTLLECEFNEVEIELRGLRLDTA